MQIIRGLQNLKPHAGSVVTIGNFDGVHIGHHSIIHYLVKKSKKLKLPSVLISFSPPPWYFFGKEQATLSNFKESHALFETLGIDQHLIINFNTAFSQLSAKKFVTQVLLDKLNANYCLVGDDFRFGAKRQGDFNLLKKFANNCQVETTQSVLYQNTRVSSSKIRALLKKGDFKTTALMLGREFSMSGQIIHGKQQGRQINIPTINIPIKRRYSPVLGVFAVQVDLLKQRYYGVCNVGTRPTVDGSKTLLEVFLFDFNTDVYGQIAKVTFKQKIRDEKKFSDFAALKKQIQLDILTVKNYFKKTPN